MKGVLQRWEIRRFARSLESRGFYMAADAVRSVEYPYIPAYMKAPKLRVRWGSVVAYLIAAGVGHIITSIYEPSAIEGFVVRFLILFLVFLYVSPAIDREGF